MEIILYLWEKSEGISLTIFMAILAFVFTLYARSDEAISASPHDLLAGTFAEPSRLIMKGLWYCVIAAFILHLSRRIFFK